MTDLKLLNQKTITSKWQWDTNTEYLTAAKDFIYCLMPLTTWQTHVFCICTLFWIRKSVRSTSHPNEKFSFLHFARQALQSKDLVWLVRNGSFVNKKNYERTSKEQACCLLKNFVQLFKLSSSFSFRAVKEQHLQQPWPALWDISTALSGHLGRTALKEWARFLSWLRGINQVD